MSEPLKPRISESAQPQFGERSEFSLDPGDNELPDFSNVVPEAGDAGDSFVDIVLEGIGKIFSFFSD